MSLSPESQALSVLLCFAAGGFLGLGYDLLRRLRLTLPFRWGRELLDLFFWLIVLSVLFLSAALLEAGRIRLHLAAGLALGAGWYFLLLSPLVRTILDLFYRVLRGVFHIFTAPLMKIFQRFKICIKYHFPFLTVWRKINSHIYTHLFGKGALCPGRKGMEAKHRVSEQKGWSSWEDPPGDPADLHGFHAHQCPPADRRGNSGSGCPHRSGQ